MTDLGPDLSRHTSPPARPAVSGSVASGSEPPEAGDDPRGTDSVHRQDTLRVRSRSERADLPKTLAMDSACATPTDTPRPSVLLPRVRRTATPRTDGRHVVPGRTVRQHPGAATVSVAAVDEDRDVIDILVRSRRAAERRFRKLLKGQGREPRRLIMDKLCSDSAAHRTVMPSVAHRTTRYENNRAEASHQPTRQRERHMGRFKSVRPVRRFLFVHGLVLHLFRVGRHLPRADHSRV